MRKLSLLIIVFFVFTNCYSQEVYFLTGSNFTKYVFKSSNGAMTTQLESGTGSSYELGYSIPLKNQKFSYCIGMTLNDYNALAGSPASSYKWETKYIGAQNSVSYNFNVSNNFVLSVNLGLNISTIIYGKQNSNGSIYDLRSQDEFSGFKILPFAGFSAKYSFNDLGYLSFGYQFSKSTSPFNNSEDKLSFNTNQLLFGIHFNINKK